MNSPFHKCSVPTCSTAIRSHLLMCPTHWRQVPAPSKHRVLAAYEQWKDGIISLVELRAAQDAATEAVVSAVEGGVA